MDNFFANRPVVARSTSSRTLLSPADALSVHSRRQGLDRTIAERNAAFYQQICRESLQPIRSSSFINGLDSMPKTKAVSVARRASAPPKMTKPNATSRPKARSPAPPKVVDFSRLPQPVFDCILDRLRDLHWDRLSSSCATCHARDLISMQLTCRAWDKGARNRLYENIHIGGLDSPTQLKRWKMLRGSRLRLLRRTLRERELLAAIVKEIEIPDPNLPWYLPDGQQNLEIVKYEDLIASVVMACPNLERLTGFVTLYNHQFSRLPHTVSTRRNLKEHIWMIGENDEVTARSQVQLSPGLLDQHQIYQFLEYHRSWARLETLAMCSPGSAGVVEHDVFVQVFGLLPSLKHLCISSFDADDFSDQTLLALPYLTSLRMEECPGVSDIGLARYAVTPAAENLKTLSLIHQNIVDLFTISKILTSLPRLTKFTIIQSDVAPAVPSDLIVFQPLLASSSLEQLHWDIAPGEVDHEDFQMSSLASTTSSTNHAQQLREQLVGRSNKPLSANNHLALSIQHSGFPRLQRLRAPQDTNPPGILQAVCRPAPNANVLLPADKHTMQTLARQASTQSPPSLPTGNSLHAARIRAQRHIEIHNKALQPFIQVVVTDHSDPEPELAEDGLDSASSSNCSGNSASTEITDPMDIQSPVETRIAESTMDFNVDWQFSALQSFSPFKQDTSRPLAFIPPRSPLRSISSPALINPLKVQEFTLPAFLGRIATTAQTQPPKFNLIPDLPGRDGNGGVVGWGDLLRISEKSTDKAQDWSRDGCTGAWNNDAGRSTYWWRHTERERRRDGTVVELKHFF